MRDLIPLNTTVFYAYPIGKRKMGRIVGYNQRYSDRTCPPKDYPYIVQWDDGVKDVVGNTSLSMTEVLNFKGRIR